MSKFLTGTSSPSSANRGLYGRGVGWIDIHLLASVIVGRLQLWTADPHLAAVTKELGVAYEMPDL